MTTHRLTHERVTWLNIVQPTPEDVAGLQHLYPFIHPLNLEDILSPIERPKVDDGEDYLFVVMHFPLWGPVQRLSRPREVDIILGRGFVVTVHDDTLKPLQRLFAQCQQDATARASVLGKGANHTFYVVIDQLVDYLFPILRKVDGGVDRIEEGIFTESSRRIIREIALARRDIIALRRIIRQQVPVLESLERRTYPVLHEDLEEYLGDLVDHMLKARDIVDENAEIIANLAETADTLASNRINEVMRVLTVISVILLPLTLISGMFGMNMSLPLTDHPQAFWFILSGMFGITVLMLWYFHRRDWI